MKKIYCLVIVFFCFVGLHAQYKVTFILTEYTTILHDSIYITGTISNWDSTANPAYLMKPNGAKEKTITLNLKPGTIRYKFHRGSWFTVEKQTGGSEVDDRVITIQKDTVIKDFVEAWRDQFFIDKWKTIAFTKLDTTKLYTMASLASAYAFIADYYNSDSAFYYAQQALQLLQKMKVSNEYKKWFEEGNSAFFIYIQETTASLLHSLGNYPKSLEIRFENLKLAEKAKDKFLLMDAIEPIMHDYESMKDYPSMLNYAKQYDSILATFDRTDRHYQRRLSNSKFHIASAYFGLNNLSTALNNAKQSISNIDYSDSNRISIGWSLINSSLLLADVYAAMKQYDSALFYYRTVIKNTPYFALHFSARAQAGMARVFQKNNRVDSALFFARNALSYFQNTNIAIKAWGINSNYYIAEISPLVAELYNANNQPDSAYKYLRLSISVKDSLYNTDKIRQFQTLGFNEANRRQQLEQRSREEKQQYETKIKMYGLISIITGFVVLAFILYRNNKQKQKANTLLQSQKQEIENTLGELQHTQKQLIQSEKMASLGELTAGIAHEIQNPLNFINNFSEVNTELIDEMQQEMNKGNLADAKSISNDIKENEKKINHHGKRADAIVKGMLQHSRSSSGIKEPTDINALADEYLRLSYHGLRAKDKSFNATMKTDFDESIGKINIVPQDIGRVMLNLINNAFYAAPLPPEGGFLDPNYLHNPTVWISTRKVGNQVLISVKDNGPGIPQKVLDKIFQPFFTTKPTGQGTGLGLSLSYDIVKAHGGELKVETKEGEGSEFIILLPVN